MKPATRRTNGTQSRLAGMPRAPRLGLLAGLAIVAGAGVAYAAGMWALGPSGIGAASASPSQPSAAASGTGPTVGPSALTGTNSSAAPTATAGPTPSPTELNVYAAAMSGMIAPSLAGLPPRVYVPNELTGDVVVIDPVSFKIVDRFKVGRFPEHIAPDWDLSKLYVDNMNSNSLTVLDPVSGRPTETMPIPAPYNLYFTLDGSRAIVVLDYLSTPGAVGAYNRLDFYDRKTWKLVGKVGIPWTGADHLDMSADGSYLMLSTEYSGRVVKVDTVKMEVVGAVNVGGLPVDVRLSPDGKVFYVANQSRNGVSIIDPVAMKEIGFLATGRGAHGLVVSRDATRIFVSNRLAGTISVIDTATRTITATWKVGGSPDMMSISADGTQLWVSNRSSGTVSAIDTSSGQVLKIIATGSAPHGLIFWPQPGRLSLGHNGVMR